MFCGMILNMKHEEVEFKCSNLGCDAEYQYDDESFYPSKVIVRVPTDEGFELMSAVFSGESFGSKDQCIKFLKSEAQKFINNGFK